MLSFLIGDSKVIGRKQETMVMDQEFRPFRI